MPLEIGEIDVVICCIGASCISFFGRVQNRNFRRPPMGTFSIFMLILRDTLMEISDIVGIMSHKCYLLMSVSYTHLTLPTIYSV